MDLVVGVDLGAAIAQQHKHPDSSVRCVISPCAYKRWYFRQRRCGCSMASS